MGTHGRQASRHEYNKPQLKEQIEEAMQRFLAGGHEVERVPASTPVALRLPPENAAPEAPAAAAAAAAPAAPEAPEAPKGEEER